jgi:hypothetical protein
MQNAATGTRSHFGMLLATLAVLLAGTGLLHYTGRYLPQSLFVGLTVLLLSQVLIGAVLSVPTRRRGSMLAIWVLVVAAIGGQILCSVVENLALRVVTQGLGLLCVGYVIVTVLGFLLRARRADSEAIFAAICVFLLMGIFWAMLYAAIGRLEPGAFSTSSGDAPGMGSGVGSMTSLYFSFVTLTTLGFGDVTPVTAAARMATVLQALTGQIYLVVLVARLVALNVAQAPPSDTDPDPGR